jgi:hypothetical protein
MGAECLETADDAHNENKEVGGPSKGQVIFQNCWIGDAPSISAAS